MSSAVATSSRKKVSLSEAMENSKSITIRMFKNETLEKLSHVHPSVPFILYIPVTLTSLVLANVMYGMGFLAILGYFGIGLLSWTLVEYILHRFIFHPPMTNEFFRKVYFYIHGIHHDAVDDASRLVMPPGASIPLAVLIYFGFKALLPVEHLAAFAGLISGYMIYDFLHFASHFYSFPFRWFKFLKKNHMRHHNVDPGMNFGFTSPLWDMVFFTYYRPKVKN